MKFDGKRPNCSPSETLKNIHMSDVDTVRLYPGAAVLVHLLTDHKPTLELLTNRLRYQHMYVLLLANS